MGTEDIKNKVDHVSGQVKERVGAVTGDESLENEGKSQQVKADVNDAVDSVKDAAKGVADDDEDYELPIYAERIPVKTVLGAPEPCPRLLPGVERPATLQAYSEGRLLEDALKDAYFLQYPAG